MINEARRDGRLKVLGIFMNVLLLRKYIITIGSALGYIGY